MRHTLTRRPRRGFTLVELLVACALTVLIMAVLATAFQTGLATFSHLKSTVGLSEQLRSAESVMRSDLEATHLENADGVAVRVSALGATPPARGYLEVIQGTAPSLAAGSPYFEEGSEDQVKSHRATDHALFFTTKLKGNSRQEVFVGRMPSVTPFNPDLQDYATAGVNVFATEWAELGYFLKFSNVMTVSDDPAVSPLKLFTLHRRQKLLGTGVAGPLMSTITPESTYTPRQWWEDYAEASIRTQAAVPTPAPGTPAFAAVNSPASVVTRANRSYIVLSAAPTPVPEYNVEPATGKAQGTDILVTNVVSMQIRLMPGGNPPVGGKFADALTTPVAAPVPAGSVNGVGFDTSANPAGVQVRAIQIKLRVYDTKNRLTRQTTMTFDL